MISCFLIPMLFMSSIVVLNMLFGHMGELRLSNAISTVKKMSSSNGYEITEIEPFGFFEKSMIGYASYQIVFRCKMVNQLGEQSNWIVIVGSIRDWFRIKNFDHKSIYFINN